MQCLILVYFSSIDRHVCSDCGKDYASAQNLREHENYVHKNSKGRYHCCGLWFRRSYELQRHRYAKHGLIKEYTCDTCGKKFGLHMDLKRHTRFHWKEFRLHCNECSQSFESSQRYEDHKGTHTDAPPTHQCPICHKYLKFKSNLPRHMKTHKDKRA